MIKALDCYVEAILTIEKSVKSGKPGISILKKLPAVLLGGSEPRIKLLDTLATGRKVHVGVVTRPSDGRFLGLFMEDSKSEFDYGAVGREEDQTTENLSNLLSAGVLSMDKEKKQLYRIGRK